MSASLCLVAITALAPVSSAAAVAPCAAGDDGSFPLGTRIHGGPDTYRAGGAPGTWYIDLVNTGTQACAGVHPVVVLVDDERLLRPSQAKLDFYDGRKRRPVRLESTDHQELVGVVGADGFAGYTVAPGKTVTVRLRLMITSDAYADHVTAKAALVQRRGQDGEWVGESEDYVFDIDGEEPDPARTKGSAPPTRPTGPTPTDEAGRPVGPADPARPTATAEAGHPVSTDEAGRPVGTEEPARPVGTDEAGRPLGTDEAGRPADTEDPGRAGETDAPGRTGETEEPSRAGDSEEPGRAGDTDDPGRPVSTDDPGRPTGTDAPGETPDPTDPDSTPVSPSRAPDTTEAGVTPAPEDPYAPDTPAPSPSAPYDAEDPDDPQLPELAHTGRPLPRALLAAIAALLVLLGTTALLLTRKRP
ncbi:hypothetical protein [Streptomyces bauhiniae]|uniref:hypothetical protein n=1 Tax=Streptomyces bauhiniae TaxID=2340725 RepID=UPI003681AE94